jgi:hypothetical protein
MMVVLEHNLHLIMVEVAVVLAQLEQIQVVLAVLEV